MTLGNGEEEETPPAPHLGTDWQRLITPRTAYMGIRSYFSSAPRPFGVQSIQRERAKPSDRPKGYGRFVRTAYPKLAKCQRLLARWLAAGGTSRVPRGVCGQERGWSLEGKKNNKLSGPECMSPVLRTSVSSGNTQKSLFF